MAKLILIIFLFAASAFAAARNSEDFARTMDRKHLGLHKKEKLTHIRVYWHDILSGPNPSSVVIRPPVSNSSLFGSVSIFDNQMTTEVSVNSTVVGQAQGMYANVAQKEVGVLMAMNLAFKVGKFKGSTITILGLNKVTTKVREMPVVGGSGVFRFARGYVEARTMWIDFKTLNATVEYNCYVLHY